MIKNILISLMVFIKPTNIEKDLIEENLIVNEQKMYPLAAKGLKKSYYSSVVVFSTNNNELAGAGSGNYFQYKNKRFIITAAHVVEGSESIYVGEKNIEVVEASIIYIDTENDIAVIKAKNDLTITRPVNFKQSKNKYIGEPVYHTGNPDGEAWHLSEGMISNIGSKSIILNTFAWPGSSGSVVFNKHGNVIGVISAIKISSPLGIPDMVEHIVIVSNIEKLNIEEILSDL